MIKNRCATKQPGAMTIPWGDIVERNQTQEAPRHAEGGCDHDRGAFERTELLFGGIRVTNQAECVVWGCTSCTYKTDAEQKVRNHLSAVHRNKNKGHLYCPYCGEEHIHMGNLQAHITGFAGRKCKKPPK